MLDCKKHRSCVRLYQNTGKVKLEGIYRARVARRDGQPVWIVDGARVARELYPEWIMGGNDQRYRFNPKDELWIDDRIGVEELEYTVAHEVLERRLMRAEGMTYDRAHNRALALEKVLRDRNERKANLAGEIYQNLASRSELGSLAAKACGKLGSLYRIKCGTFRDASIWIVDGPLVRSYLEPNFCFGDNGLMGSPFIPEDEIWLDSAMSASEYYFTLMRQKLEYAHVSDGSRQSRAYDLALLAQLDERDRQEGIARTHEQKLAPVRFGARFKGVKS